MATGIFKLRDQLLGLVQKAWTQPPTYAGVFSGSNLSISYGSQFDLSGGSYTIEMWFNPIGNYGNYNTVIAQRGSNCSWEIYFTPTNGYMGFYNGTLYSSTATPIANAWNHIAAVYDGTNINLYLNGTRVLVNSITNTNYTNSVYIGGTASGEYCYGQLSNIRVVKGTAVYTGATYTVPKAT